MSLLPSSIIRSLPALALGLVVVLVWEVCVTVSGIRPQLLPPPSLIVAQGWAFRELIWLNTVPTLIETAAGFTLAIVTATVAAMIIDFSATARRALYPLMVASQALPIVAIAPLLVLWFGFGLLPKALVVALVTFFPITVGWVDGFATTELAAANLLRSMGASRWQLFWMVRVPGALPSFFSGLRIAISYAVVGAVFAEYVGAKNGLGIFMQLQQNSFRTDLVMAAVAMTALISIVLFIATYALENLMAPWQAEAKDASPPL